MRGGLHRIRVFLNGQRLLHHEALHIHYNRVSHLKIFGVIVVGAAVVVVVGVAGLILTPTALDSNGSSH